MAAIIKKAIVKGRVQGVFYRASTREKALSLELCGYAKNLSDGSVEVLAQGEGDKVEELMQWLWTGSPASDVSAVTLLETVEEPGFTSFTTA
ncbi:acylphosphatase [Planctobacterium marinum]|uniref:acylphosphatase n=1 Tax=Planctobacterium marinum TaxID=1631968 RepID=A0AA48HPK8_9ALTE|nr:hypothetical protein MACH26_18780 [Planctobacterium marinum]